ALQVQVKGVHVTGIYPAPFTDKISVTLSSESAGRAGISLFDNTGKRLSGSEYRITKGVNTIRLTGLDNLSKGLYILKVQIGEEVTVKKLVK
ncbi:MAG TPA: T9SS type A sorting domain-containing protein, partial [Ferruginibacter sp.]|nr:T9SS type A sorting domain-containing protein [Ferruginibacter sp.]